MPLFIPPPQFFTSAGAVITTPKIWYDIITPSTANGFTIDISNAGFANIKSIQLQAANNTNNATTVPMVSVKTFTTTQIIANIVQSNNSLIGSLLSPIIGLIFPVSVAGITIHVLVFGD